MRKGKLIVLEGISGSGQQVTSGLSALHKALVSQKYNVVECANPDAGRAKELGASSVVNWPFGTEPRADFLFESAVRTRVFEGVIRPALDEDKIVLCKQSSISSLANAWLSGFTKDFDVLRHLDKIARGFLFGDEIFPDLTIFFDVTPEAAHERVEEVLQIKHEGGLDYYRTMREFYLQELPRWRGVAVDASSSRHPDQINEDVMALVKGILG